MSAKSSRTKKRTRATAPVFSDTITPRPQFVYWLMPALVALTTFVAFLPTLQNGFVNWDDESFLVNNHNYRGLGWQQIRWMFTTCYLSSCMPLTWVTLWFGLMFSGE